MALPNTPDNGENEDKKNPGQKHYDNTMGAGKTSDEYEEEESQQDETAQSLSNDEQASAGVKKLPDDVSEAESNFYRPSASKAGADKAKAIVKKSWIKRAGPLSGILGAIFGGGLIFIMLTSPSLLIIHVKEIFTEKFNTQLSSMDARTTRLNMTKVSEATKGMCGATVTVKCRFSTMSEKQVTNFKNAGIEVVPAGDVVNKRTKPLHYIYKGQTITAADFSTLLKTDQDFRGALKKAYNPKFGGFNGKAWKATAKLFGLSKKAPDLSGNTDEERQKKLNTVIADGMGEDTPKIRTVIAGEQKPGCVGDGPECKYTAEEAKVINDQALADANALNEDGKSGAAADKVRNALSGTGLKGLTSAFNATGILDSYCTAYGTLNAISYASKTLKVIQLARAFMVFSVIADKIKAGDSPDPAEVAFLGTLITTVLKDAKGDVVVGAGTDSFGYKFAAYGDTTAPARSMQIASRFTAGGGGVGELSKISTQVTNFFPGGRSGATSTCGVLANPIVQGGSLIVGVAMLFIPGVNIATASLKLSASLVGGLTINAFLQALPAMLADIVAGTTTQDIVGEEMMNAQTSGAGAVMSDKVAGFNGNGLLTKDDAVAYTTSVKNTSDAYIADELKEVSPFDANNPHTFLGTIASSLLPLQSRENPLGALGSLVSTSISTLTPKTSALTAEEYRKGLEVCQDIDAVEGGYAVDPFCNPIRGIPTKYLEENDPYYDTMLVLDRLTESGNLSDIGTPIGEYKTFIEKCITSTEPPGYADGVDFQVELAKNCIVNDDNVDYYLHYIDRRTEEGMSGEEIDDGAAPPVVGGSTTGAPAGAIPKGAGWTFATGGDYSSIPCDPRTPEAMIFTSDRYGYTMRLCTVNWNSAGDTTNGANLVSSAISTNVMNMFEAARAGGVELGIADGMRLDGGSTDYYSEHATGLAMDLSSPGGTSTICFGGDQQSGYGSHEAAMASCQSQGGIHYAAYQWLNANAATYGFYNYLVEPWHWSTSGT